MGNHHAPLDRLVHAYRQMTERVGDRLAHLAQTEQQALCELRQHIEHAADEAVELDELTREEARLVASYLRRDLEDAGQYLADTGRELSDWLKFDVEYVEQQMFDRLSQIADHTRLDWLTFNTEVYHAGHYYTGDVTGPGTLCCEQCGHELGFPGVDRVPSCPTCQGTVFSRVSSEAETA